MVALTHELVTPRVGFGHVGSMVRGGVSGVRHWSRPRCWVGRVFRSAFRHETRVVQLIPSASRGAVEIAAAAAPGRANHVMGNRDSKKPASRLSCQAGQILESVHAVRVSRRKSLEEITLQAPNASRLQIASWMMLTVVGQCLQCRVSYRFPSSPLLLHLSHGRDTDSSWVVLF
ncbi:hypothetical protein LZ30DRAFT_142806 [Colletotrichum cereale]|nr:hypothetical protein LZ30DRAFT_142806 [Colletotrichum cereale]